MCQIFMKHEVTYSEPVSRDFLVFGLLAALPHYDF